MKLFKSLFVFDSNLYGFFIDDFYNFTEVSIVLL